MYTFKKTPFFFEFKPKFAEIKKKQNKTKQKIT